MTLAIKFTTYAFRIKRPVRKTISLLMIVFDLREKSVTESYCWVKGGGRTVADVIAGRREDHRAPQKGLHRIERWSTQWGL